MLPGKLKLPGPSQSLQLQFIDVMLLGSPNVPNQCSLVLSKKSEGNLRSNCKPSSSCTPRTPSATKAYALKKESGENRSKKQIFKDCVTFYLVLNESQWWSHSTTLIAFPKRLPATVIWREEVSQSACFYLFVFVLTLPYSWSSSLSSPVFMPWYIYAS